MSDTPIQFPQKGSLNTYTWLPVTMQQFQDLTNELLVQLNAMMAPHCLEGDYLAQVLMSAIHALDHKQGKVRKSDLFEACVNRVSCHVTYHAVEEIQKRIKAKAAANGEAVDTTPLEVDPLPDEVHGEMPPAPDIIK